MSISASVPKTTPLEISQLTPSQDHAVAALLHRSLVHWYERNLRQGERFGTSHLPFLHFPALYRNLDPEHCLGAWSKNQLVGVAFIHPRETHISAGIIATDPEHAGSGIAKRLLAKACELADSLALPLRLVSSLLNLDSFSLYSRHGFQPVAIYQDIQIHIPDEGLSDLPATVGSIRKGTPPDAEEIARAELQMCGISRLRDHQAFLSQTTLPWEVLVFQNSQGTIDGALTFTRHPDWSMVGPAFASDETVLDALLSRALDQLRGKTVVLLIPATARTLLQRLYTLGGRNIELHALQVRGKPMPSKGISLPTFLPETF